MIRSISFSNYKGLSGQTVPFERLTLLTGGNGTGKSSVIQAILLARLADETGAETVPLNDRFGLSLGEAADIFDHSSAGDQDVILRFAMDDGAYELSLYADAEDCRYLRIRTSREMRPAIGSSGLAGLTYLAAERICPQDSYDLPSGSIEHLELGHRGQYAAAIISDYESFQVPEILEHPKAGKLRLGKQVEAWLGTFFPEIQMRVLPSRDLGKAALRFKFSEATDEWLRPGNTGFGVTYCLPIIVAGLLAKPGSLLIVDSPEAHLHPSAQSAMGEFLSAVAVVGGQVIVETHSDHVLNGVRLAVMKAQLAPPPSEVMINHFGRRREQLLEQIAISPRGELSNHPIDFFDQAEKDLGEIVRQRFASQAGDLAG